MKFPQTSKQPEMIEHSDAPPNLYFSSVKNPSLAQLRDVLRRQTFSSLHYSPKLESTSFRNQYSVSQVTDISSSRIDPEFERKNQVIDLIMPYHKRMHEDRLKAKALREQRDREKAGSKKAN